MIYASSDWHGYPLKEIQALLKQAHFGDSDFLFVLGDVIDRGKEGILLLRWLMLQPNIQLLLGNHEAMMLACRFLFEEITAENVDLVGDSQNMMNLSLWLSNGGQPTVDALQTFSRKNRDFIPEMLAFLEELPLYETVTVKDHEFVLVHGGLEGFQSYKPLEDYEPNDFLWCRPKKNDRYFLEQEFPTTIPLYNVRIGSYRAISCV